MEYTVCLLFSPDLQHILLQKKKSTIYAGLLNDVGGKIENDETPREGALREIKEEMGITKLKAFTWLGTPMLPFDCAKDRIREKCTLHFYASVIKEAWTQPKNGEKLFLYDVSDVLNNMSDELAGDGNLEYFIRQAVKNFIEP